MSCMERGGAMTETQFEVSFRGRATVRGSVDDHVHVLDVHLDDVMDHLVEIEEDDPRLSTADLHAKLAMGEVELSITVQARSPEEATAVGLGAIRTATHAAGGHTPIWGATTSNKARTWTLEFEGSEQRRLDPAGT